MLTNRQIFLTHLGQTSPAPLLLEIEKAEGIYLYGPDGKKYIDLISGVSVSNVGHRNPQVIKAIHDQTDAYLHLMVYGEMIQSPQVRYAEMLSHYLPEQLSSIYYVNSGSEAVEGALKLAKRYTGRTRIIHFRSAYHGSTHGAMSVQGSEVFRSAFRPLLPDTWQIDFNDFASLDQIDEHTACVIIEPVQAEAGVIYPAEGFLQELRKKCTSNGALLIFDEAQTGFGRLGSVFAVDKFGVIPDILVLAKALGGGMPLGAFIASGEIMSTLMSDPPLGHITTFGGHPVCCAAGLASFQVLINEKLSEGVSAKSQLFRSYLRHPAISGIRGDGLLLAVTMKNQEAVKSVITKAPEFGLILDYFLFCDNAFRIAPPLTITDEEIQNACGILTDLINAAVKM